ncbi:MAG: hypothetical protein JWO31_3456 [Phycisphaerales bacterium]|nr:hypothetical protein [Phycisphaerales bacterium]
MPDDKLTDAEYLRRQGERAKTAIMGAATALKATATGGAKGLVSGFKGTDPDADGTSSATGQGTSSGADGGMKAKAADAVAKAQDKLQGVVREHPWYTVAAAAATGFAGAVYLDPTRFGRLRGRIKKLEARLKEHEKAVEREAHAAASPPPPRGDPKASSKDGGSAKASLLSSLGTMVLGEAVRTLKPMVIEKLAPIMAGMGGIGTQPVDGSPDGGPGDPEGLSPEVIAALRERIRNGPPPGYGGPETVTATGQQVPPRAAGDASI